jgi:hypothetical protein
MFELKLPIELQLQLALVLLAPYFAAGLTASVIVLVHQFYGVEERAARAPILMVFLAMCWLAVYLSSEAAASGLVTRPGVLAALGVAVSGLSAFAALKLALRFRDSRLARRIREKMKW